MEHGPDAMTSKTFVYQIFYDDTTERMIDPSFIPLDNRLNERPDWREYWPIRSCLRSMPMDDEGFYGFFSPRFFQKTGLSATEVLRVVGSFSTECDVIHFSPYLDMNVFHWNIFEQGEIAHPGLIRLSQLFFEAIGLPFSVSDLVNHASNTIFCNFFVAKPAFWRAWFEINERLFAIAENGDGELADRLRTPVAYENGDVAMKVFLMERTASYLLSADPRWRSTTPFPFSLPSRDPGLDPLVPCIAACDALKLTYVAHRVDFYRRAYFGFRRKLIEDKILQVQEIIDR